MSQVPMEAPPLGGNPPQMQMVAVAQQAPVVVYGSQAVVLVEPGNRGAYTHDPVRILCQHCGADVIPDIQLKVGMGALQGFCICCMFGLIPCAPCAFCISQAKDATHICPSCKKQVG